MRQRRLSSFELDALMVVEVDIAVNHLVGFREGSWLVSVDAFCFEDSDILPSASLPFCELQKIPQQLVFHL